jgi:hypothetical protein
MAGVSERCNLFIVQVPSFRSVYYVRVFVLVLQLTLGLLRKQVDKYTID